MSLIKYVILSVFVLLFSCTSNEMVNEKALFTIPSSNHGDGFNESMTEEEILAYNNDQPILNQIECRLEAKSSKIIRKRVCKTIREWSEVDTEGSSRVHIRTIFNNRGRISDSTVIGN